MNKLPIPILVADDDANILSAIRLALKSENFQVSTASSPQEVLTLLERKSFACALIDLNYSQDTTSGIDGLKLIEDIRNIDENMSIIAITGYGSIDIAVEAMKTGANDFIEKPWRNAQLITRIHQQIFQYEKALEHTRLQQENSLLRGSDNPKVIAESKVMTELLAQLERVAKSDMNVLFTGENGTGKSMLAKYLHGHSIRKEHSFLSVNMGGISETLFESEMFGHVKGAFTDAKEDRIGRFELAKQGTLFLDEIANIQIKQQAKLLHVLEERIFERVGSTVTQQVDVRLVSATNADLSEMIIQGNFRQDLLYRLNTMEIRIPALRERPEDILPLANFFIRNFSQKYQIELKTLTPTAEQQLLHYAWPGNIRELSHTIERALFLSNNHEINSHDLALPETVIEHSTSAEDENTLSQIEKRVIVERLAKFNNDPVKTADSLGLTRSSYYRRLEKHGLNNQ